MSGCAVGEVHLFPYKKQNRKKHSDRREGYQCALADAMSGGDSIAVAEHIVSGMRDASLRKKTFLCIAIEYSACGRTFECTLDGLVSNKAESPFKNDTHLPRCVGADIKSLGKINKINTLFMVVNLADF